MSKLYNGTSAYSLEEYEQYADAANQKRKNRSMQRKRESAAFCRFLIITVAAVFCIASAIVYTNVMIIRASSETEKLKDNLVLITEKNKQTEMEIAKKLDMTVIENKAINELGMQRPDNSQIVYLNIKQNDYTEVSDENSSGKKMLNSVKDAFEGIVEYFR